MEYLISSNSLVEVNALNKRGLTALDILSIFDSEAGDREIADILIQAGALTAQAIVPHTGGENATHDSTNYGSTQPGERTPTRCRHILNCIRHHHRWLDYFKYMEGRDSAEFVRSALLLVAALIATATYTAVLQPPGGLWQDNWPPLGSNVTSIGTTHKAGQAVLGTQNPISYALFLCFNSMGFFASIQMIAYLTNGFPLRMELRIALAALVATYNTAMGALTPNTFFNFFFVGLAVVMPIMMFLLSVWVRK